MSNVIKFGIVSAEGARVITHKPIHNKLEENKLIQHSTNQIKSEIEQYVAEKQSLEREVEELQKLTLEMKANIAQEKSKAQEELEQLWETARQELEAQREQTLHQANQKGFEEGYQTGYQQIQEEMASMKQELVAIVQAGYEHKDRIIQDSEPFLLNLSTVMARKIIQHELAASQEQILAMIQEGMKQVRESGAITIEVSPEHYPLILAHLDELEQYLDGKQELRVLPSDVQQVSQGCFIHTQQGTYDLTIDNQLNELKRQLLSIYEESVSE